VSAHKRSAASTKIPNIPPQMTALYAQLAPTLVYLWIKILEHDGCSETSVSKTPGTLAYSQAVVQPPAGTAMANRPLTLDPRHMVSSGTLAGPHVQPPTSAQMQVPESSRSGFIPLPPIIPPPTTPQLPPPPSSLGALSPHVVSPQSLTYSPASAASSALPPQRPFSQMQAQARTEISLLRQILYRSFSPGAYPVQQSPSTAPQVNAIMQTACWNVSQSVVPASPVATPTEKQPPLPLPTRIKAKLPWLSGAQKSSIHIQGRIVLPGGHVQVTSVVTKVGG
jgi:hypothetical protein